MVADAQYCQALSSFYLPEITKTNLDFDLHCQPRSQKGMKDVQVL